MIKSSRSEVIQIVPHNKLGLRPLFGVLQVTEEGPAYNTSHICSCDTVLFQPGSTSLEEFSPQASFLTRVTSQDWIYSFVIVTVAKVCLRFETVV